MVLKRKILKSEGAARGAIGATSAGCGVGIVCGLGAPQHDEEPTVLYALRGRRDCLVNDAAEETDMAGKAQRGARIDAGNTAQILVPGGDTADEMAWAGLRYGDPSRPRFATGRVDGKAPAVRPKRLGGEVGRQK